MTHRPFSEALMELRAEAVENRADEFLTTTDPAVEVLQGIRLACETIDGLVELIREIPRENTAALHRLFFEVGRIHKRAVRLRSHTSRHIQGLPIPEEES